MPFRDKPVLFFFLFCLLMSMVKAQTTNIKGFVTDTFTHESLTNATICLLQANDSFLYKFTRVQTDGRFTISDVDTGKYILLVSYPQYVDFVELLAIDGKANDIEVGKINLIQTAHMLEDVIVTQQIAAIRIKGDTTEFKADSFKVQPNASVEDLLKRFPGFQVDKDGKITAQGRTVEKVLVDGEEFFGDDPTLVTRNLRADMVDKVQLFDKTSDQAAFTGIDDGNKQKTLNIVLKADKKNGYFGKVSGGIGSDKFYETQDMFNYFKNKTKFSAYGTFGNTGKTGLGFQDAMKYGSSSENMQITNGGIMVFSFGDGDDLLSSWNGSYDGKGFPDAKTGGVHFDSKWNNDKQSVNLNYKIGGMSVSGSGESATQSNLPGAVQYSNTANNFNNHIFRQKLDGIYELQIDSSSSLKISASGSLAHNSSDNFYTSQTRKELDTLVNNGNRALTNEGDTKSFSGNMLWRKKFKKKGRTISLNINEYINNSSETGYLKSKTDFYQADTIGGSTHIDQRKSSDSRSVDFDSKLTYTEPLSDALYLVTNYGVVSNNANSEILSFDKGTGGAYDIQDNNYSNHYVYDQFTHRGGAAFNYNRGKIVANIGTNINAVKYTQTNLFSDSTFSRHFINWVPTAQFSYKFSQRKSFDLNYSGYTEQPSIAQIQPVANNNDNLNQYIGNPGLKPSFSNDFHVSYNDFRILGRRYLNIYGSYTFTMHPIVTNVTTDLDSGKNTYNYFNLNTYTNNYYGSLSYNRKWEKLDLNYGFGLNISGDKYVNFTNNVMNITHSNNYNFNASIVKYEEKKFDLSLNASVGYNVNQTSLDNQINNNAWDYSIRPNIDIFLPAKFQIHTDGNYIWQQKTATFNTNYNRFIWNAWIGKKFFEKENLLLKVSVNDILDQNIGFDRNVFNNTISQSSYTTIRRYFLLSLVWDFSKMGPADKK